MHIETSVGRPIRHIRIIRACLIVRRRPDDTRRSRPDDTAVHMIDISGRRIPDILIRSEDTAHLHAFIGRIEGISSIALDTQRSSPHTGRTSVRNPPSVRARVVHRLRSLRHSPTRSIHSRTIRKIPVKVLLIIENDRSRILRSILQSTCN